MGAPFECRFPQQGMCRAARRDPEADPRHVPETPFPVEAARRAPLSRVFALALRLH
jgi:hypothetical protein